ncbi:MAG: NAD-dependent epimerase/dehydratase family protein [SAR324 cluster bacterium]|nr:NAD-dependent epimerase/dehydratase family protein [SAR324 cluster bacterium]
MILITGGAGFVGSSLALRLKAEYPTRAVVAFDNLKRRGSELNLPRLRKAGVQFVHGDVRNPTDLELPDVEWIIECSAEPSALAGRDGNTDYLVHTNLLGTHHCLELARRQRAGMIFLSTSRVYPLKTIKQLHFHSRQSRFELAEPQATPGVSAEGIAEDFPLEGSRTLYGATKLASELLITEYVDSFDLPIVINRCGVLTGPWQMGKVDQGVVVLWMARHLFGGELSYIGYNGTGLQVRDMLHVEDLADLVCLQMNQITDHQGKIYNVGGGPQISVSLQELTAWCEQITGNSIKIVPDLKERAGDVPWFITNTRKIQEATGWQPRRDLGSVLNEIHDWIKEHQKQLRPILS